MTCALAWFPRIAAAQGAGEDLKTSRIQGTVYTVESDGGRAMVPGAVVKLTGPSFSDQTITDDQGKYSFAAVTANTYRIDVTAPGLNGSNEVIVASSTALDIPVELKVADVKESVTVTGNADITDTTTSSDQSVINKSTVWNAPNQEDRVDNLLPLVPGVVRGPDGLINMKGARSSQGGALVNSSNATDPVTGNAAMSLPIDVVESVKVIANPYDPEYGRLTGAVASVETVTGNLNTFRMTAQNLMVRPRNRDGSFVGIESATPRMTATGPLIKNKVAFTQSFEYRYVRTPVSSLPPLERDIKFEGFNSYSQLDATLTQRQSLTASFALYPQKLNYLGLNTFAPQPSTPDLHQRGYMGLIQHHYATGADSLLVSQFSYKRFDADVTANSSQPYELMVETTAGGFFDKQHRETYRTEWQETYEFGLRNFAGVHQFKAGADFAHSDYDGRISLQPVSIIGVSALPVELIGFGPPSGFDIHQNEIAWFLADKWMPFQRLTLDLGVRFDRDSVTHSTNTAPRAGFALVLTSDVKTLLKGGVGLFYDRVPLNIVSFPLLPDRTVTTYSPTEDVLSSIAYTNTITEGLRNPRSVGWNLELDRQITSSFLLRAGFQERNTARDFVITPEPNLGILSVSNAGRAFYREFQITGRYKIRRGTLNASYVRSQARGNLNDFNQFFGNNAAPVIQPDAQGRLSFDAPNRFLTWGQWETPFKLTVLPVLDIHTGFPYSLIDQSREFIGPRNSERFPRFWSFDLQVTRLISIPLPHGKVKARVGVSVFNLFNRFNPRDVQNDIDSYRFGAMFNGVGRTFRGKFILEF
ncbi:MAG TPA: TonB-dependent receptor [Bryobacteraceae bacterium]|nr:TonB-dependent receptor [Bryobacteraceae bacterium]